MTAGRSLILAEGNNKLLCWEQVISSLFVFSSLIGKLCAQVVVIDMRLDSPRCTNCFVVLLRNKKDLCLLKRVRG